jgi:hypothetical protein
MIARHIGILVPKDLSRRVRKAMPNTFASAVGEW